MPPGDCRAAQGGHRGLAWPHRLGLTTLVIFYLLSSTVGGVLGGVYNTVSGAIGGLGRTAATTAGAAAPAVADGRPDGRDRGSLRDATGGNDPAALRDAAVTAMRAALTGDEAQAQEARERAAAAIARAQNIPIEEARTQVTGYEQQYRQTVEQARQQATEAADTAATVVSRGALFGFFALALGAVAAWFGGRAGAVYPTLTNLTLPGRRRESTELRSP